MNRNLRHKLNINQHKNTEDVIDWFKSINERHLYKFVVFEIKDFRPFMKESLERARHNHKLSYNISEKYINNNNNNKDNCNSIDAKNSNNYNNNKFKPNNKSHKNISRQCCGFQKRNLSICLRY